MSLEVQPGILRIHCEKPAINTNASPTEAARVADTYNSSEFLKRTFFGTTPDILQRFATPSSGEVTTMKPSGPYTEGAVMVIAHGPDSFNQEYVGTEQIYDYPADVQHAYWGSILTALKKIQAKNPRQQAIAVENCISQRTSADKRTSRSVGLPHSQTLLLNPKHITPESWNIPHLTREQKLLNRSGSMYRFMSGVQHAAHTMDSPLQLEHRQQAPFGYEFTASEQGSIVETTLNMAVHHEAYRQASTAAIAQLSERNQKNIIPQPSYRMYMYIENDGSIRTIISPEVLSHAGVLEAMGIQLQRSVDTPRRIHPRQEKRMHKQVAHTLSVVVPTLALR